MILEALCKSFTLLTLIGTLQFISARMSRSATSSMADGNAQDVRDAIDDFSERLAAVLSHVHRAVTKAA
jgi:hypothetical protein